MIANFPVAARARACTYSRMHPASKEEIRPLTSLRFFAASLVFCEHIRMIPGMEWIGTPTGWPGAMGVSVFFVLSGFILCYSYGDRDWKGAFGANAREYYGGRVARIYPLHWIMFLAALPLGLHSNTARVSIADFPLLLTLTDKLWPGYWAGPQPDKVAWTLSCEAIFYLLLPLVLLILAKKRNPLAVSAGMLAACTALVAFLVLQFPNLNWSGWLHVPEFLLGIAGFQWYRRANPAPYAGTLLIGGIALLGLGIVGDNMFAWQYSYFGYAPGALAVILGCASLRGSAGQFLSRPFFVLMGNASYALYLLHETLLRYTKVMLDRHGIILAAPWNILAALLLYALCLAISVACYRFYETPARLKIRSFFQKKGIPGKQQPKMPV